MFVDSTRSTKRAAIPLVNIDLLPALDSFDLRNFTWIFSDVVSKYHYHTVAVAAVAGGLGEDLRAFYVPSARTRSMVV